MEGENESFNIEKAIGAGLSFRSLEDTIYDVYQWEKGRQESERQAGISHEKEQELIEAWLKQEKKDFGC